MADSEIAPIRWTRVFALLLALFLVAEAAGQLYFYAWTGKPFGSVFLYRWSPYGLYRNNPDLSGNFQISGNGFREVRDYARQKPPHTFRVMLMGGSVLYAGHGGPYVLREEGFVPSSATISQYLAERLRRDPAFKGTNVEVINTAANFYRLTEIADAYLADYIQWSPDAVIVMGSKNNFGHGLLAGEVEAGQTPLQRTHPFALEFDRLVTERSPSSALERLFRQAADESAAMALLHKGLDAAADRAAVMSLVFALVPPIAPPVLKPASQAEADRYMKLYDSLAAAMIGAARQSDQEIAFFWEYFLGDLKGIKPLSAQEQRIYPHVRHPPAMTQSGFMLRDKWKMFLATQGVPAVDPEAALRRHNGTVFIDYLHYTKGGNRFMADVIYDQLRPMFLRALAKAKGQGDAR